MEMEIDIGLARERYSSIPEYTLNGLYDYVDNRIPPGGFLRAVLSNNLFEAFARADENNRFALNQIIQFVYMEMPSPCWGNEGNINTWLREK